MVKHEPELHTQRLGGTTGARPDERPDDEVAHWRKVIIDKG